jgi:hypothetical protein
MARSNRTAERTWQDGGLSLRPFETSDDTADNTGPESGGSTRLPPRPLPGAAPASRPTSAGARPQDWLPSGQPLSYTFGDLTPSAACGFKPARRLLCSREPTDQAYAATCRTEIAWLLVKGDATYSHEPSLNDQESEPAGEPDAMPLEQQGKGCDG